MKILIAEDELLSASHLKIIVMEMGYAEPQIVDNTEKLLQSIAIESPNLVLIDVRLKGIKDGIVAAEIIAASENPIPVIFITAMKDATTFERAKKTQPHSYITKPFQVEELQDRKSVV